MFLYRISPGSVGERDMLKVSRISKSFGGIRALKVSRISKSFGGIRALKDVDLDVKQGEIHGIIGPNGSGKTTLFNCITGLLDPDSGHIFFGPENITNMKPNLIAERGIRRTFQAGKLVPGMTVLENVMSGLFNLTARDQLSTFLRPPFKASKKERALERSALGTLKLVAMENTADRWAYELVWAERQFIQIARALVSKPKLLLLDEPTSGMGLRETAKVEKIIKQIRDSGVTVIVVSHHVRMLMNLSDRVTVLNFGKRISEGPPERIREDPRVLEAYLGME